MPRQERPHSGPPPGSRGVSSDHRIVRAITLGLRSSAAVAVPQPQIMRDVADLAVDPQELPLLAIGDPEQAMPGAAIHDRDRSDGEVRAHCAALRYRSSSSISLRAALT
jgi:hypothetical protein